MKTNLEQARFPGEEFEPGARRELVALADRGDTPVTVAALQLARHLLNIVDGPWNPVGGDASELIRGAARTLCGVSLVNDQVPALLALAGLRSDYGPIPEQWEFRKDEIAKARVMMIRKAREIELRILAELDSLLENIEPPPAEKWKT